MTYLLYRLREIPVWMGIPLVAALLTKQVNLDMKLGIFSGAIFFQAAHILLFNDWGDLKNNPDELKRFTNNPDNKDRIQNILGTGAILTFIMSFLLGALLIPIGLLVVIAILGGILSVLYSYPALHLKQNLWASSALHFLGGQILFVIPYIVFSNQWITGLLWGTFFSLIFVAGHLVHECIDYESDRYAQINTKAVKFGPFSMLMTAITIFFIAHIYLGILTTKNIISLNASLSFLPSLLLHSFWAIKFTIRKINAQHWASQYRLQYRLLYAVCSLVFLLLD